MKMIAQSNVIQIENDESRSARIKITEDSNPKREQFKLFIESVRGLKQADSDRSAFNDILENLKTKSQSIYNIAELSQAFEYLLKRAQSDKRYESMNWSQIETVYLVSAIAYYCLVFSEDYKQLSDKDWQYLEGIFPTKQVWQIIKKWKFILNVDIRQFPWSVNEDKALTKLVADFGAKRTWKMIAAKLEAAGNEGITRGSKQCKERWFKHLDPKVNKSTWSQEEDCRLMRAYISLGRKWSEIAKVLGGRTDTAVRNRWIKLIKEETQKEGSLDLNLSYSDEGSAKIIAKSIIDKIRLTGRDKSNWNKQDSKVGLDVQNKPIHRAIMHENTAHIQKFKLPAERQSLDFSVYKPAPVMFTPAFTNGGSGMIFTIVNVPYGFIPRFA